MSKADQIFINNMKDIMENGYWDTDLKVRPHWEDGTPAHTVKNSVLLIDIIFKKNYRFLLLEEPLLRVVLMKSFGFGKRNQIIFTTYILTFGTPGRTKMVPSVKPMVINSPKNQFIQKVNSIKLIEFFMI